MTQMNRSGMAKVEQDYQQYGVRARELHKEGNRFIGYICSLVPLEIITAAGFAPFRIRGDVHDPITKADAYLETIACPFMRSCFDQSLNLISSTSAPIAKWIRETASMPLSKSWNP